jgi:hypothetical protein
MKRPLENNSSRGQAVYEPFCGSGTSIIAAEITGRICHAIELNPAYVDVAVQRWQAFTGEAAKLESDGCSFADVAADRKAAQSVEGAAAGSIDAHADEGGAATAPIQGIDNGSDPFALGGGL